MKIDISDAFFPMPDGYGAFYYPDITTCGALLTFESADVTYYFYAFNPDYDFTFRYYLVKFGDGEIQGHRTEGDMVAARSIIDRSLMRHMFNVCSELTP